MYFKNRVEAGQLLAEKLKKYRTEHVVVMTLGAGGIVVGAEISKRLHCALTLLLTEQIKLPGEPEAIAMLNQDGGYTDNHAYSDGQIEEFESEYYHFIEQEKMDKIHSMNRLLGKGGYINRELLRHHTVILASDGISGGFSLDAALEYLKPIHIKKLVVATPIASLQAVDRMHILADEIYCISVMENYIDTNHYYDANDLPDQAAAGHIIETAMLNWE